LGFGCLVLGLIAGGGDSAGGEAWGWEIERN